MLMPVESVPKIAQGESRDLLFTVSGLLPKTVLPQGLQTAGITLEFVACDASGKELFRKISSNPGQITVTSQTAARIAIAPTDTQNLFKANSEVANISLLCGLKVVTSGGYVLKPIPSAPLLVLRSVV